MKLRDQFSKDLYNFMLQQGWHIGDGTNEQEEIKSIILLVDFLDVQYEE